MKLLIKNINTIFGINEKNSSLVKGSEMDKVQSLNNAYMLIENGKIYNYGSMNDVPEGNFTEVDLSNKCILPGWCDSHTHLVFAHTREDEFVKRIKGLSYLEIAESGGGILNSARKMQYIDESQLYDLSAERLIQTIKTGTTSIEIKSGYGLTEASEYKMLRVIKKLKENFPISIKANFLGAHAIPSEYKDNRNQYIDLIINKMIPHIAEEGLADYIDVFCDKGFYTVEETDRILQAGSKYNLKAKIHANELANSGGVQIGIKNNAVSVDHLEEIEEKEINALLNSSTIPTLLPGCSFFLKIPYAPARKMIDSGLGICLASDYNPGTCPSSNMNLLMSIACTQMKITPSEAFNAMTINGACAMEMQHKVGAIKKGYDANFIVTKRINSIDLLAYHYGDNLIDKVIVKGNIF